MSTRAMIKIVDNGTEHYVYHHWDGYPDGVGQELKDYLKTIKDKDWKYSEILDGLLDIGGYEEDSGIHGDEEYGYLIDCNSRILVCYKIYDNPFKWEECKEIFRKQYNEKNNGTDFDKGFEHALDIAGILIKEIFENMFSAEMGENMVKEFKEKMLAKK